MILLILRNLIENLYFINFFFNKIETKVFKFINPSIFYVTSKNLCNSDKKSHTFVGIYFKSPIYCIIPMCVLFKLTFLLNKINTKTFQIINPSIFLSPAKRRAHRLLHKTVTTSRSQIQLYDLISRVSYRCSTASAQEKAASQTFATSHPKRGASSATETKTAQDFVLSLLRPSAGTSLTASWMFTQSL